MDESAAAVGGDLKGRLHDIRHADNELPLCVFGPGGEYRTAWLPGPILSRQKRDTRLTAVPLAAALTDGRLPAAVAAWWSRLAWVLKASQAEAKRWMRLRAALERGVMPLVARGFEGIDSLLEKKHCAEETNGVRPGALSDAAADRNPHGDSRLPSQRGLFPDVAGDRRRVRHQQDHRVRARRNPARKRDAETPLKQGTLFGADVLGPVAG